MSLLLEVVWDNLFKYLSVFVSIKMVNNIKTTLTLPKVLVDKTKEIAKEEGATFSGLVRVALEKRVNQK